MTPIKVWENSQILYVYFILIFMNLDIEIHWSNEISLDRPYIYCLQLSKDRFLLLKNNKIHHHHQLILNALQNHHLNIHHLHQMHHYLLHHRHHHQNHLLHLCWQIQLFPQSIPKQHLSFMNIIFIVCDYVEMVKSNCSCWLKQLFFDSIKTVHLAAV